MDTVRISQRIPLFHMIPHWLAETLFFLNNEDQSLQTVQETASLSVVSLEISTSGFREISYFSFVEAFFPRNQRDNVVGQELAHQ